MGPDPKDPSPAVLSLLNWGGVDQSMLQQLPHNELDVKIFSTFHSCLSLMTSLHLCLFFFLIKHPAMLSVSNEPLKCQFVYYCFIPLNPTIHRKRKMFYCYCQWYSWNNRTPVCQHLLSTIFKKVSAFVGKGLQIHTHVFYFFIVTAL